MFCDKSKASYDMVDLWQMQGSPKSLLVPPKFFYVTNCSPKPPTSDKNHYNLVVMLKGGVFYLKYSSKIDAKLRVDILTFA